MSKALTTEYQEYVIAGIPVKARLIPVGNNTSSWVQIYDEFSNTVRTVSLTLFNEMVDD